MADENESEEQGADGSRKGPGKTETIQTEDERGAGPIGEPGSGKAGGEGSDDGINIGHA